jgi:hypothetical protein
VILIVIHHCQNPLESTKTSLDGFLKFLSFESKEFGFDARLGHVGFIVDEVELGQVLSKYFCFSPILISPAAQYSLISLSSMLYSSDIDSPVKQLALLVSNISHYVLYDHGQS